MTSSGVWDYRWTLTHPTSGTILTGNGRSFDIGKMQECGRWIAVVDTIDPVTGVRVSSAESTFTIACSGSPSSLAVDISARPLTGVV